MALSSVETALQGIFDRFAYQIAASQYVVTGGTDVWSRTDAADDETFENQVNNAHATALDTAIADMDIGDLSAMTSWLNDVVAYCSEDLGYATIDAYLTAKKWRVDQRVATLIETALNQPGYMSTANVHGPADAGASAPGLALGTFERSGSSVGSQQNIDTDEASPSIIRARVTALGTDDWTITATFVVDEGSTEQIEQVVSGTDNGGAVGDTYDFGAEAVTGEAASGQADISVAATDQFAEGMTVLVREYDGETLEQQEYAVIDSMTVDTSITVTSNLLHTYSTDAYVYPCFIGVSDATDSGGSAGDAVTFYPAPDRELAL